jgi:hypothetical protein
VSPLVILDDSFFSCLGGVVVSVFAAGPKGSVFKPSRGDGFLMAVKSPQHTFLQMGSKARVLILQDFTACKRILLSMI